MRHNVQRIVVVLLGSSLAALGQRAPAPDSATITATTRLVYEDVVVRDSQGRVVHGLTLNDFKLKEDGASQQIDYFDEYTYASPAAQKSAAAMPIPSMNARQANPITDFTNAPAPGAVDSVNIVLFDLLNTPVVDQLPARRALLNFLTSLPPGHQVELFVLTDRLHMFQNFTSSSDRLIEAAQAINPKSLHLTDSRLDIQQADDYVTEFAQLIGRDPGGAAARLKTQNNQNASYNLGVRLTRTLRALAQLARATSGYPGRKNLLWLSSSFPVTLGAQMEFLQGAGVVQPDDARETTNLLTTAQMAVYPISLLGLETEGVSAASSGLGSVALGGGMKSNDSLRDQFTDRAALRVGMNDLAFQTGGIAFVGTNDFARALRLSMEDGSNYYTLAYRPQNQKADGRFHKIHVELVHKGYSLSYRRGYFAFDKPASSNSVLELNAAVEPETPESTMLLLKSKVAQPGPGIVQVASTLDVAKLSMTSTEDGHKRGKLLVLLVAYDDTPGVAAQPLSEALPQTSAALNLDFDAAQYQRTSTEGISFTQQLKLKPGRYRLRLGVTDLQSRRLGTLDMSIQVGSTDQPSH